MKRKTAKEILAESLHELAGEKNLDKITIREIVDNCGYSPATFYRHFKDKYDLIAWDHTRAVAGLMGRIDDRDYRWNQALKEGALWLYRERDYLTNLFQHTSGHDSFIVYMVEINYNALKKHILSMNGRHELDREEALLLRTYCLGTVGLICEWILGAYEAKPEEIARICEQAIPENLKKYLS